MTTSKPTDIREFWVGISDTNVAHIHPTMKYASDYHVIEYRAVEQLKAENEKLRMQLSACSCVALANTTESAILTREMHPDYMCAAVADVCNAVDREMKLREQVNNYEQALKFECGDRCAEQNPCNAREALKKWGAV